MSGIMLSFADALKAITQKTYMGEEDAATLLKFEIHKPYFIQQIGREPNKDEAVRMMESFRKDKALAYYNYEFPSTMIYAMITKIMSTMPDTNEPIYK